MSATMSGCLPIPTTLAGIPTHSLTGRSAPAEKKPPPRPTPTTTIRTPPAMSAAISGSFPTPTILERTGNPTHSVIGTSAPPAEPKTLRRRTATATIKTKIATSAAMCGSFPIPTGIVTAGNPIHSATGTSAPAEQEALRQPMCTTTIWTQSATSVNLSERFPMSIRAFWFPVRLPPVPRRAAKPTTPAPASRPLRTKLAPSPSKTWTAGK